LVEKSSIIQSIIQLQKECPAMLNRFKSLSPNSHSALFGVCGVALGFVAVIGFQSMMGGNANVVSAKAATIETGQLARQGIDQCRPGIRALCANVEPGGGRFKECIRKHLAEMTPDCRATIDARLQRQFRQQQMLSTSLIPQ
jgi:hypothetical protein